MCGIAGFISRTTNDDDLRGLERALHALTHRGPDDRGTMTIPEVPDRGSLVGLGNRRLSIIDLSAAGHQPMTTADGRYSVTYNGEIYNYAAIREQLEAKGHRFRSRTDTEVFLEAYAEWGTRAFERLEGMFAAAIVDRASRTVVLVRDGFGIKPLFYSRGNDRLVFASEIAAVFAFGGVGRRVNAARLHDYLVHAHTSHPAETLFADVRHVPPAHYLTIPFDLTTAGAPVRYWSVDSGERRDIDFRTAAAELQSLVVESVGRHLQSDVPVGFSLSGGTDSSSVLLSARRSLGNAAPLHAFGFAADDATLSEVVHQERAVAAAGATLHSVTFDAGDLTRDFERMIDVQGEPFGSPAICAQYKVFTRARDEGVKVILGGQGADELFAGYQDYFPSRAASLLRTGHWLEANRFVGAAATRWNLPRRQLARSSVSTALPPLVTRTMRRMRGKTSTRTWINNTWFAEKGVVPPSPWRPRGREAMKEHQLHIVENVHLQALMRYEDRSSAALSMENRVPFLTPRLARFAFSLPEAYLISRTGEQKAVLRAAMRGIVPDAILDRRDKLGFAVPIAQWLVQLAPWVEQRLSVVGECPAIDKPALDRHWSAVRSRASVGSAYLLWRCLTLGAWAERGAVEWQ